jgi:hypothetical protein
LKSPYIVRFSWMDDSIRIIHCDQLIACRTITNVISKIIILNYIGCDVTIVQERRSCMK